MSEVNIQTKRISSNDQKESVSKSMKDYNNASNFQLKAIESGKGNIQALELVPVLPPHNGTFQIVDFGCSEGRNSMFLIRQLLDEMNSRKDYVKGIKKIIVYHEDLPDNNFEALRDCAINPELGYQFHELVKANGIETITECIGKTYYEQIVKNDSIEIAFCYNSLHWMPEYRSIPYGLMYDSRCSDEESTSWFNDLSERSLSKWLDLRYKELKKGGLLSFNIMTGYSLLIQRNDSWVKALTKRGLNHRDFEDVIVPIYIRNSTKLHNMLSQYLNKFRVIKSESITDHSKMSKQTSRAILYNQIRSGLSKYPTVFSTDESIEEFYNLFENELYKEFEELNISIKFEWIVLQKI